MEINGFYNASLLSFRLVVWHISMPTNDIDYNCFKAVENLII